jgi:conjugal transfer pilus assembly protein TraK
MKHSLPISMLLMTVFSSAAQAQQSASATFGTAQRADAPAAAMASAELPRDAGKSASCERTVTLPCKPKRAHKLVAASKSLALAKVDPLAVHPEAALKDIKAPEVDLPGVMKIAGADAHALDFTRARVIEATNGGAQTVYVSAVDQNRIQLPWQNSSVNGTEELDVKKSASSNNVFVQFKDGVKRPVLVYFEQPGGGSVVALQLVPKNIVGQTVLIRDASLRSGDPKAVKGSEYVASTQGLMEDVALGGVPQGFSQVDLATGPIAMNGLVVTPQKQYSSADRDIYVYDVVNPGPAKASLQEKEFDGENVLAVSIFPKPIISANEHTKVIVFARKASGG